MAWKNKQTLDTIVGRFFGMCFLMNLKSEIIDLSRNFSLGVYQ